MLQKGFSNLILPVLAVAILIGIGGGWYFLSKTTTTFEQPSEIDSKLTIPKSVNLFLESLTEENQRLPVIVIKAFVGPNGCYRASDLKIKQELKGDKLTVNILGYQDLGNISTIDQVVCADMIIESRAKIKLDKDWLQEKSNREIIFLLNGHENSYQVNYQQNKFSLNGIRTINVLPEGGNPLE